MSKAPLPAVWGVLYNRPNPDGSRKQCLNCAIWVEKQKLCTIHGKDLKVSAQTICGYHFFGKPFQVWPEFADNIQYVKPKFSGLERVPGGTSCNLCKWYESKSDIDGLCNAVNPSVTLQGPTKVEAMGCCARWEKRE